MDAVEFVRVIKRMLNAAPIKGNHVITSFVVPEEEVARIEQWAKEHPIKTRQSLFLEQYPEAKIDDNGCLSVCPYLVSAIYRDTYGNCLAHGENCYDCRRKFWWREVK